jgi:glycosyltransferase involved in cell wall biosynthesis
LALVSQKDGPPTISVIIPCYNAKSTIFRCLKSICQQHCSVDFEILIIDSSDDGSDQMIKAQFPKVQLIHFDQRTLPGIGRNYGAQEARGSILVFTDADCIAPSNWLQKHYLRHKDYDVVGGSLNNANPFSFVGWASFLLEFSGFTPSARFETLRNLITANVSYKKHVFPKEGFPQDIWPGEDRVFHWKLADKTKLYYDGSIYVSHWNRSQLSHFFTHQGRLGKAAAASWSRIDVKHKFLLDYPALVFLTPFWRGLVMPYRIVRDTPNYLLPAAIISPLHFIGAFRWAAAFYKAVRNS